MKTLVALTTAAALSLASIDAIAEKADREKPINVESDRMTADDAAKVLVFEGRVIVTQGTMILRAERITMREDKDGSKSATAIGKPATFRQKRDNVDEWIDGEADRIEYDGKAERIELFIRARMTRDKDEVRGNYISYDQRTEFFQVQHAKDGSGPAAGDGRIRAVLQPKPRAAAPESAAPALELKSIDTLPKTR